SPRRTTRSRSPCARSRASSPSGQGAAGQQAKASTGSEASQRNEGGGTAEQRRDRCGRAWGQMVAPARRLRRRSPKGSRRSVREISAELTRSDFVSRSGNPAEQRLSRECSESFDRSSRLFRRTALGSRGTPICFPKESVTRRDLFGEPFTRW